MDPKLNNLEDFDDDVPEIEFVEVPPGKEPPSDKDASSAGQGGSSSSDLEPSPEGASSSSEPEAPSGSSDPLEAISKGFKELGDVLKNNQTVQPQMPIQQPGESDEEFAERLKEALFSEDPLPALKEAVQRFTQPALAQANYTAMELAKKVMVLDPEKGPIFKKYQSEIEDFIKTLPPNVQTNPGVYDYAYKEIYSRHIDEIVEERVKQKEQELLQKLQQQQQPSKTSQKKGPYMVGEPTVSRRKTKKVYYTQAEKEEADRRGIPLEDYLRIKGRI